MYLEDILSMFDNWGFDIDESCNILKDLIKGKEEQKISFINKKC